MTVGPEVPGYELLDVLGRGGFGVVYRAHQVAVDREVAVKVDNRALTDERDRRRFLREVRAAGQLSAHPHVVNLYDAGTLADGRPYLVMERCDRSLHHLLTRHGPLPAEQVRDIGVRIADALSAAHASGILHRDIKPANILVNPYGVVALSDFGLASILDADGGQSATMEALTPAFAPPEAFHETDPTPLFDVYSLAATLYTLVAGHPPRLPDAQVSIMAVLRSHAEPIPEIPGVPPRLQTILRQGLETEPARRLGSAASLRDLLAAADLSSGAPTVGGAPGARDGTAIPPYPPPPRPGGGGPPVPVPAPAFAPNDPGPSTTRGRRPLLAALAAAGLVAISVGSYIAVGELGLRGRTGTSTAVGTTAVPGTVGPPEGAGPGGTSGRTDGGSTPAPGGSPVTGVGTACAATRLVPGSWCATGPECWNGPVYIAGVLAGIRARPCASAHAWQTFAIAPIPADLDLSGGPDQETIAGSAEARAVCSPEVLRASLTGPAARIPISRWKIEVLPPTQAAFDDGTTTMRCLATVTGQDSVGSAFTGTGPFRTIAPD